jgi:uncharacterized protein (DUF58 family)
MPEPPTKGKPDSPAKPPRSILGRYSDELILLGVSIFLLFVASNTQAGWLYLLNSVLLGTLLAGFIISRLSLLSLKVEREIPPLACEDETVRVTLKITNKSRLARYSFLVEEHFPADTPDLLKNGRQFLIERLPGLSGDRISYEAACYKRGIYRFPPLRISAGAPIGFFTADKKFNPSDTLTVLPTAPPMENGQLVAASRDSSGGSTARLRSGHSHDFLGIRQHQPGESTRMVHWPSTARTGSLMLRQFGAMNTGRLDIFLDTGRRFHAGAGREASIEYAVKLATSAARHAILCGQPVHMTAARGKDLISLLTRDLLKALRWLAGVEAHGELENGMVFSALREKVPRGGRLLMLLTDRSCDPDLFIPLLEKKVACIPILIRTGSFEEGGSPDSTTLSEEKLLDKIRSLGLSPLVCGRGDDLAACLRELGGYPR